MLPVSRAFVHARFFRDFLCLCSFECNACLLYTSEEDDFSRMPPRGYARNMVNAYARLVGLNPTEMTRMYLDDAYAYQVGRARNGAQPSGFDRGGSSRTGRSTSRQGARPSQQVCLLYTSMKARLGGLLHRGGRKRKGASARGGGGTVSTPRRRSWAALGPFR